MKQIVEKIAFVSFIVNSIFLGFIILLPILVLFDVEFVDKFLDYNKNNYPNPIQTIINVLIFFHLGYCIWFLFKYDRYSKSIFPLLFFNAIYAPFYYYSVKIKKRPLRNKINKSVQTPSENNTINDDEFLKLTRENIINVLELWSSKDEQLDYQKNVPQIQVPVELFGQWADFYSTGAEAIIEVFNQDELKLLEKFDNEINNRADKTNIQLLQLDDYIMTEEWKILNLLAKDILRKIKN